MNCLIYEIVIHDMPCLWIVLSMKLLSIICPVYELSYLWNGYLWNFYLWKVLSMKYPYLWIVLCLKLLSKKCPVYEVSIVCPIYEIIIYKMSLEDSIHWDVPFMNCPYLWNVLSTNSPIYKMSCLWMNVYIYELSMKFLSMKCPNAVLIKFYWVMFRLRFGWIGIG